MKNNSSQNLNNNSNNSNKAYKLKYIPYSFSKISTYQHCPMKFKLNYIDKIRLQTEHKAFEKGKFIHHVLEHLMKKESIPDFKFILSTEEDIKDYKEILNSFIHSELFHEYYQRDSELEVGFSLKMEDGKVVADGYSKDSMVLGFIDYISIDKENNRALIVDWKTGKYKKDINKLQVKIYSLWAMLYYEIENVDCEFVFVEHNKKVKASYNIKDKNNLIKDIFSEILFIEKAQKFKKNPSALCDYCDFKKQGYCDGEYDFDPKNFNLGLKSKS